MHPPIQIASLLLLLFSISDAKIEFTHSTIYDVYDFIGREEISLPRCNDGCLIFATAFGIYENVNMDPYLLNLTIIDSAQKELGTVAELVNKFHPDTTQKLPLDVPAKGAYSIRNLNPTDLSDDIIWDVTVWIIERAKAQEIDYEIYDAATMKRAPAVTNSVITIMGGSDSELTADKSWEVNSYSLRLAGFDNAFDDNEDGCQSVMQSPLGSVFDGFKFEVMAPIMSLVFDNKTTINVNAGRGDGRYNSLSSPGFLTSPGYVGCSRLGADQVYRNMFYKPTERLVLNGHLKFYQVDIELFSDLGSDSHVDVMDVTDETMIRVLNQDSKASRSSNRGEREKRSIGGGSGRMHYQMTLPNTQMIFVDYNNVTVPHSFFLRYSATRTNRVTTTTKQTTTPTITSTAHATTTSAAHAQDIKAPAIISTADRTTSSAAAAWTTLATLAVVVAARMLAL